MQPYLVTLRFQYPAHDERNGITFEITAASKSEAIARARQQARRDGHTPTVGKGGHAFSAKPV